MPNRHITDANNYRYTYQGQEKDPETGKEAFELRLWDSRIGRWLSPDPAKEFQSPYLGMGNNPMKFVDKKGDSIQYVSMRGDLLKTVDDGKRTYSIAYEIQTGYVNTFNKNTGLWERTETTGFKTLANNGKWIGTKQDYLDFVTSIARNIGFNERVVFHSNKKDGFAYSFRSMKVQKDKKTGIFFTAIMRPKARKLNGFDYNRTDVVVLESYWNIFNALEHEFKHRL